MHLSYLLGPYSYILSIFLAFLRFTFLMGLGVHMALLPSCISLLFFLLHFHQLHNSSFCISLYFISPPLPWSSCMFPSQSYFFPILQTCPNHVSMSVSRFSLKLPCPKTYLFVSYSIVFCFSQYIF